MGSILSNKSVSYHSPSSEDWEEYKKNIESFKEFKVPKIFDEKNKHDYLFIALADGTENDMKEPSKYTNIAKIREELKDNTNPNIATFYKDGVGTYEGKGNILDKTKAKFDAALSLSHEERVKEIYEEFSKQANIWKSKDPNANISIVEVGFSRGSGVVSLLNQMIHEKGIKDTETKKIINGKLQATGDYLISPGQISQSVLLYDPVTTSMKENMSLSNSTVSALQINAKDEYRNFFPLSKIAQGEHQLEINLPGCHTDIGGGYDKNGLSLYSKNIGNQYLNKMIHTKDKLFKKTRLPSRNDPSVVIHHSEEHSKLYKKEKQRGITLIDKKVYQKKIASLNISKNDNSKLLYSPIYTNSIKEFKIQKLKKAKTIEKEISRKERFIRFR